MSKRRLSTDKQYLQASRHYKVIQDILDRTVSSCLEANKNVKEMPIKLSLDAPEEKSFAEQYGIRLKQEQQKVSDDVILYTKITMAYAIKQKLCFLELAFHPKSIATRKYFEKEQTDNVLRTLEDIIVWETTKEKTYLSKEQLDRTIQHFRELQDKQEK